MYLVSAEEKFKTLYSSQPRAPKVWFLSPLACAAKSCCVLGKCPKPAGAGFLTHRRREPPSELQFYK